MIRIGCGFDIHPLKKGRLLKLGGIEIPHHSGLYGHSDADILIHALCDALLGALALGDIGSHFPNSDPSYKNCNSLFFLSEVIKKCSALNASVINVDTSVVIEKPKLSPFIPQIQSKLALAMNVTPNQVSVKATTGERLGFVGREEGVAVYAVALLEVKDKI